MKANLKALTSMSILATALAACGDKAPAPAESGKKADKAAAEDREEAAPVKAGLKIEDPSYDHNVAVRDMALLWKVDGESLKVKLAAKTTGWIGVGFNPTPNEGMKGANFVLAYVKDGQASAEDHFGNVKTNHKPDEKLEGQTNVTEVAGKEESGVTEVSFAIPLKSGDDKDTDIDPAGETNVLLAWGKTDALILKHKFYASLSVNLTSGEHKVLVAK
jgi:predicted small lipoprotein YifL